MSKGNNGNNKAVDWEEQQDTRVWVRFDEIRDSDAPDNVFLLNKGEHLQGKIIFLEESTSYPGKYIVTFDLEDGANVNILTPSRLVTDLGLNPEIPRKHIAQVGDLVKIVYEGKEDSGKGNPSYVFKVFFAKQEKNSK